MSERKVISKYIPQEKVNLPQSLVSSGTKKKKKNNQTKVRMMAPMTIRCTSCGAYAFQGTKFNSRKEVVYGEKYLGISILRFYQRCKVCGSEFTLKTDPKNEAYVAELGCVASYEPWKEIREQNMVMALDELAQQVEEDTQMDAIKQLEQRVTERKKELEMLDRLDELKTIRDERHKVDVDELLKKHSQKANTEEDIHEKVEFTQQQLEKLQQIKESSHVKQNSASIHNELMEEVSRKRKIYNNLFDDIEISDVHPSRKRKKFESNESNADNLLHIISNSDTTCNSDIPAATGSDNQKKEDREDQKDQEDLGLLFGYSSD